MVWLTEQSASHPPRSVFMSCLSADPSSLFPLALVTTLSLTISGGRLWLHPLMVTRRADGTADRPTCNMDVSVLSVQLECLLLLPSEMLISALPCLLRLGTCCLPLDVELQTESLSRQSVSEHWQFTTTILNYIIIYITISDHGCKNWMHFWKLLFKNEKQRQKTDGFKKGLISE